MKETDAIIGPAGSQNEAGSAPVQPIDMSILDPSQNGVLDSLKRIEKNTAGTHQQQVKEATANVRALRRARASQRGPKPPLIPDATVPVPAPTPAVTVSPARVPQPKPVSSVATSAEPANPIQPTAEPVQDEPPADERKQPSRPRVARPRSPTASEPVTVDPVFPAVTGQVRGANGRFVGSGKSKAEQALEDRKADKRAWSIADIIRKVTDSQTDSLLGGGDAENAIGTAAGGAFYGAAMEMRDAYQQITNEDSLTGKAIGKLRESLGRKEAPGTNEAETDRHSEQLAANERVEDGVAEVASQAGETLEAIEEQTESQQKQHKEQMKALAKVSKSAAASGGGLLDFFGVGGGGAGNKGGGKAGGKGGIFKRTASRIGKALGMGGKAAAGATAAGGATKAGGLLSKAAGAGGKVLGAGSRALGWLAAPITGALAYSSKKDELAARADLTDSQKTAQATSTGLGAGGGALGGAAAGATIGATVGSVVPLVGNLVGGIGGAIVGGIVGAWGGEKLGEAVGEAVSGTMDSVEEEAARILEERETAIEQEGKAASGFSLFKPSTWFGGGGGGSAGSPSADLGKSSEVVMKEMSKGSYNPVVPAGDQLGRISEKYESGGRGVGTISTGIGDAGGVSYGKYQLASKTGTMNSFLKSPEGQQYAERFAGLKAGSREFNDAYTKLVKEDGAGFDQAQHDFIKRTHFDPVANYAKAKGIDVENEAIQEALWSQSVQHSGKGNKKIIDAAIAKAGPDAGTEDMISAIYDARGEYASQFASSAATTKRYAREKQDVLALARQNQKEAGSAEGSQPQQVAAAQPESGTRQSSPLFAEPERQEPTALVRAEVKSGAEVDRVSVSPIKGPPPMLAAQQAAAQPKIDTKGLGAELAKAMASANKQQVAQNGGKENMKSAAQASKTEGENNPVPVEFDDTLMMMIAHDRV